MFIFEFFELVSRCRLFFVVFKSKIIIKNMSNRNIMSVIDDIEKTSIAFVFLFIIFRLLLEIH